jgi:hypothetical protein
MLPFRPNRRQTKRFNRALKELMMRKHSVWMVGILLLVGQAGADGPQPKPVKDLWDAAYLGGAKIGSFHTSVRSVVHNGEKRLRTTQELDLTIKRYKALARIRVQVGSEETKDGKITAVFMTQFQDKDNKLVMTGEVEEKGLHVKFDGGRIDKMVRWNDKVLSAYRQELLFSERKVKAGDEFSFLSYEPQLNYVITIRAAVKEPEDVDLLKVSREANKPKVTRVKERLLRVELKPDKVEVSGNSIQLPGIVLWLDGDRQPVRSELEMPGLGNIVLYRTTREVAMLPNSGEIADLGANTKIPLNRRLERFNDTKQVVYRVTYKGEGDVETALAKDNRQEIKNVKGQTFELHVQAVRAPRAKEKADQADEKFLKNCWFIDSDNVKVKELTRKAVGAQTDPWKKARAIETWVHEHMKHDDTVAFCPAGQVAANLKGDCRQHAMLMAAMCRAAGIGSRTAIGLVYGEEPKRGPVLVYHMWTEVWVNGEWLALDATLGQGSVGAGHIKIADHSWHEVASQTPFLPVQRVLGKLSIEIVSAN